MSRNKSMKKAEGAEDDDFAERWLAYRTAFMERVMGKRHKTYKQNGFLPFRFSGKVAVYFYPKGIPGTGFATLEVSEPVHFASKNKVFKCYELVMYTKARMSLKNAKDPKTPIGRALRNATAILSPVAWYSAEKILNPGATMEFPKGQEDIGGKCLILDNYSASQGVVDKHVNFGVMVVIEIFRSEMKYACRYGGTALLKKLKAAQYYPYSDLDRKPVV